MPEPGAVSPFCLLFEGGFFLRHDTVTFPGGGWQVLVDPALTTTCVLSDGEYLCNVSYLEVGDSRYADSI